MRLFYRMNSPLLGCIFLLQFIIQVIAQDMGGISFKVEPSNVQLKTGETGYLMCAFTQSVPTAGGCFWNKDGGLVDISERYQFIGSDRSTNCSIQISDANLGFDDGVWQCGIPSGSSHPGLKSHPANFTVLSPPELPTIRLNKAQVQNGSDLVINDFQNPGTIECQSKSGHPAARVQWIMAISGQTLAGTLTVTNDPTNNKTQTASLVLAQPLDPSWQNQVIACVASHPFYNQAQVVYVYLRLKQSPTYAVITSDSNIDQGNTIYASTSDTLKLYCIADGYPIPDYNWKKRSSDTDDWVPFWSGQNSSFQAFDMQVMCIASNGQDEPVASQILSVNTTSGNLLLHTSYLTIANPTSSNVTNAANTAQIGTVIAIVIAMIVLLLVVGAGIFGLYKKKMWPFKVPDQEQSPNDLEAAKVTEPNLPVTNADDTSEEQKKGLIEKEGIEGETKEENTENNKTVNETNNSPQTRQSEALVYAQLNLRESQITNRMPPTPATGTTQYASIVPRVYGHQ